MDRPPSDTFMRLLLVDMFCLPAQEPVLVAPVPRTCIHRDMDVVVPHACPYDSDVNDDASMACTCCKDCTSECADSI